MLREKWAGLRLKRKIGILKCGRVCKCKFVFLQNLAKCARLNTNAIFAQDPSFHEIFKWMYTLDENSFFMYTLAFNFRSPSATTLEGLTVNVLPLSCLISLRSLLSQFKCVFVDGIWGKPPFPLFPTSFSCVASSYSNSIPSDHVSSSIINYSRLFAFVHGNTFLYLVDEPM